MRSRNRLRSLDRSLEIVTRKRSPEEGLDAMAVEVQRILGGKAHLLYPVRRTAAN